MKKWRIVFQIMCCVVVFSFLLLLSGCEVARSMARTMSSGPTGCPPDEIIIENLYNGLVTNSWIAKCEGKTYFCSQISDGPTTCNESRSKTAGKTQTAVTTRTAPKAPPNVVQASKAETSVVPQSTLSSQVSMVVTSSKAKIREKPSVKATIVKTLQVGEKVQVIKQQVEWFQVELAGGDVGWCHKSVLKQTN